MTPDAPDPMSAYFDADLYATDDKAARELAVKQRIEQIRAGEGSTVAVRHDVYEPRPLPRTVPATHIVGPTNPTARLTLCQEWAMRAGEYDDIARVQFEPGTVLPKSEDWPRVYVLSDGVVDAPFAYGVAQLGLEAAIRALHRCLWCSADDFQSTEPRDCSACLEVAHS